MCEFFFKKGSKQCLNEFMKFDCYISSKIFSLVHFIDAIGDALIPTCQWVLENHQNV